MLLWSAGNANASEGAQVEGAIPPMEGAVSPLRPEAVQEAERELKLGVPAGGRTALHVTLPPAHRSERSAQAPERRPVPVAFHRDMPEEFRGDMSSGLEWTPLGDGALAAAMSVTSPGATDVRMGILVDLPPGGELRFFGADAGRRFPVITRADLAFKGGKPQTLWSPVMEGDTIGVEITLPSRTALSAFSFHVDRISHGYEAERALESGYLPEALECSNHYDFQCGVGRHFPQQEGTGAVLLRFEESGAGYACSGTLLSDREDTFVPYLLTANHCISTALVASSVSARWFYQRSACGGSRLDSRDTTTSGGAELLATSQAQDSTLLRLERRPPEGVWYHGWDPNRITHPRDVYLIHHPDGGVKKYSAGRTTDHVDVITSGTEDAIMDAIMVDWSEGTTENGSSGAGLFAGEYLIGVHAGRSADPASCLHRHAFAGAFSDFYPRIRRWLEASTPPPPRDDHGNIQAGATRVSIPSTTRGRLEQGGDVDWFRVTVSRAGELRVETTGSTDTFGTLFGPGGEIGNDDDGGGGNNFRVVADVWPGTHYAEVRGHNSSTTGDYSLKVELSDSPPPPPPPAHTLPLVMPASSMNRRGFVRINNHSNRSGTVRIHAIDDSGRRFGPVSLSLDAKEGMGFSSQDLERGNPEKGLPAGVGDGTGNWRLELRTTLDIEPLAYVRTPDGFLTSMHDVVAREGTSLRYRVPIFNPASNRSLSSRLRLINPGARDAGITIDGVDARGNAPPGGQVRLTLPAGAARTLSAQQLEEGDPDSSGRFGDGEGKWQLFVSSSVPIEVMNLMQTRSGHLANLSTSPSQRGVPASTGWARSGTGSTLFGLPVRIERIRIDGEFFGDSESFAVWCGGPGDEGALLVNTILGTDRGRTRYSGFHSARRRYNGRGEPCRELQIKYSQGVRWTVSQVSGSSNSAPSPAADSGGASADRAAVERARAQVLRSRVRQPERVDRLE